MEIKKETETEEGTISGTSPDTDAVQVSNTAQATVEEQENADLSNTAQPQDLEHSDEDVQKVEPVVKEENGVTSGPAKVSFTQSQVDEIVGKTRKEVRERLIKNLHTRYGVNSEEELDEKFADAQRFETLRDEYDEYKTSQEASTKARDSELSDLKVRLALLESGIDKERYDDAKFILQGKGLDITTENILNELATHPEWKKVENPQSTQDYSHFVKKEEEKSPIQQSSRIKVLGNDGNNAPEELSERDQAMALFSKF